MIKRETAESLGVFIPIIIALIIPTIMYDVWVIWLAMGGFALAAICFVVVIVVLRLGLRWVGGWVYDLFIKKEG